MFETAGQKNAAAYSGASSSAAPHWPCYSAPATLSSPNPAGFIPGVNDHTEHKPEYSASKRFGLRSRPPALHRQFTDGWGACLLRVERTGM
jgi:hypothetical protein